jgi:hypothetical protein
VIHLIQVDRDGIMSFACDEVELFTTQGATREVFRSLVAMSSVEIVDKHSIMQRLGEMKLCPYCVRLLTQRNSKNSGVRR